MLFDFKRIWVKLCIILFNEISSLSTELYLLKNKINSANLLSTT